MLTTPSAASEGVEDSAAELLSGSFAAPGSWVDGSAYLEKDDYARKVVTMSDGHIYSLPIVRDEPHSTFPLSSTVTI